MSHEVFIEGCTAGQQETLAATIAKRFGADAEMIKRRLSRGRFRVKSNVDLKTAQEFVRYLESHGAQCSIIDANGKRVGVAGNGDTAGNTTNLAAPLPAASSSTRLGFPSAEDAKATTLGRPAPSDPLSLAGDDFGLSLAAPTPAPPPSASLPGPNENVGAADPLSGAGSDFSAPAGIESVGDSGADPRAQTVGAFGALDGTGMRLDSLDGHADKALVDGEKETATEVAAEKSTLSEEDRFLPPEAQGGGNDFDIDLDDAAVEKTESRRQAVRDASRPPSNPGELIQKEQGVARPEKATEKAKEKAPAIKVSPVERARKIVVALLGVERPRFALGVVISLLLGFAVSSFVASKQEQSRRKDVVEELLIDYRQADTPDAWDRLERVRTVARNDLENRRKRVVMMAMLVWLIVSGALAFLWMRVIDWSIFEPPVIAKMKQ